MCPCNSAGHEGSVTSSGAQIAVLPCECNTVCGAKPRPSCGLPKLINRRTVAIGAKEIPAIVPAQAERIHLSPCVLLHARAIHANAPRIAAVQRDRGTVPGLKSGLIAESMRAVEPPVWPATERGLVPVGVFLPTQRAEEHLFLVGLPVAIRVLHQPDVRNAPDDAFPVLPRAERIKPDRDVQAIGEDLHFPRATIRTEVRENAHGIPRGLPGLYGKWILARFRYPQTPCGIEGHVHRLP
jgi:hypothetical protein